MRYKHSNEISAGNYSAPKDYNLLPTVFSLIELTTSQAMVKKPKKIQDTIKMIYNNGLPTIPENPFDFVLQNQFDNYVSNESSNLLNIQFEVLYS